MKQKHNVAPLNSEFARLFDKRVMHQITKENDLIVAFSAAARRVQMSDQHSENLLRATTADLVKVKTMNDMHRVLLSMRTALKRRHTGRKIKVQPTAPSRRTFKESGSTAQKQGRKSNNSLKKRRESKRKHNLAENVRNGVKSAKLH